MTYNGSLCSSANELGLGIKSSLSILIGSIKMRLPQELSGDIKYTVTTWNGNRYVASNSAFTTFNNSDPIRSVQIELSGEARNKYRAI